MTVAESGNAEAKGLGTFPDDINEIIKHLRKLSPDVSLFRVCYEAGPTGFGLSQRLKKERNLWHTYLGQAPAKTFEQPAHCCPATQ